MFRRWFIPATGLVAAGSMVLTAPALTESPGRSRFPRAVAAQAFVPEGTVTAAPGAAAARTDRERNVWSAYWSGYALNGGTFTTATASWVQSAIRCTKTKLAADVDSWAGLDGFTDKTVEQTGTEARCHGTRADYFPWYEMYPRAPVTIRKPVKPGDLLTSTVTHTGGTDYRLTLKDATQGWTNTVTRSLAAHNSSAEAIVEDSSQSLANFGTESFAKFKVDGKAIGSYKSSAYTIERIHIRHNANCDRTSALTGNENFTVTWLYNCYP
jgi:hypothetical protein